MSEREDELVKEFIESMGVIPSDAKKAFSLGFIGPVGVGKSFVAKKLSSRLGICVTGGDQIRKFLHKKGIREKDRVEDLVLEIGSEVSRYLYSKKIDHIVDTDLIKFHRMVTKNAETYNAKNFFIQLVCPEDIILKRIEKRKNDVGKALSGNLSRAGKSEYFKRKKLHESLEIPQIFYTVDTSGDIDLQLDKLIHKLTCSI